MRQAGELRRVLSDALFEPGSVIGRDLLQSEIPIATCGATSRIDTGAVICVGVVNETFGYERRVAIVPEGVARIHRIGADVVVQRGAGVAAHVPDAAYAAAGATLVDTRESVYERADILTLVGCPTLEEAHLLRSGLVLIGLLQPWSSAELLEALAAHDTTAMSLERMPRIARAQSMDVLSSQSSLSGYKAAVLAADAIGKLFPMMITAAGTIVPTRVLVLGAGVAGLQAIATARRLGALVQGYDIRPAAREQVESLGATFLSGEVAQDTETQAGYARELGEQAQQRERQVLLQAVHAADVVITTALVPGRPAPILLTESMVETMTDGSVIVDLAAEMGGNCELTEPGQTVTRHGVTIIGAMNLPSTVPVHASQLYSRNLTNFLEQLVRNGKILVDLEDPVVGACCVTHAGSVRYGSGLPAELVHA